MDKKKLQAQVAKVRAKAMQSAEKEIARVKQNMDKTAKQVELFARKNPEKAALISAGIGAALGAAVGMLIGGGKKKKKK